MRVVSQQHHQKLHLRTENVTFVAAAAVFEVHNQNESVRRTDRQIADRRRRRKKVVVVVVVQQLAVCFLPLQFSEQRQ